MLAAKKFQSGMQMVRHWAEMLAAAAYSLFEEEDVLSRKAGAPFRDEVLARGGSRPALESFMAFRAPIDALLRHNGMSLS